MPDCREGQYIIRELNIPLYCPTQRNARIDLLYDSNSVVGKNGRGGEKEKKKKKREGKEKKTNSKTLVI